MIRIKVFFQRSDPDFFQRSGPDPRNGHPAPQPWDDKYNDDTLDNEDDEDYEEFSHLMNEFGLKSAQIGNISRANIV